MSLNGSKWDQKMDQFLDQMSSNASKWDHNGLTMETIASIVQMRGFIEKMW